MARLTNTSKGLGVTGSPKEFMDMRDARVKEQAEAHLRQLRTIPYSAALELMEGLLNELYSLRDMYTIERDGCDPCDKFRKDDD